MDSGEHQPTPDSSRDRLQKILEREGCFAYFPIPVKLEKPDLSRFPQISSEDDKKYLKGILDQVVFFLNAPLVIDQFSREDGDDDFKRSLWRKKIEHPWTHEKYPDLRKAYVNIYQKGSLRRQAMTHALTALEMLLIPSESAGLGLNEEIIGCRLAEISRLKSMIAAPKDPEATVVYSNLPYWEKIKIMDEVKLLSWKALMAFTRPVDSSGITLAESPLDLSQRIAMETEARIRRMTFPITKGLAKKLKRKDANPAEFPRFISHARISNFSHVFTRKEERSQNWEKLGELMEKAVLDEVAKVRIRYEIGNLIRQLDIIAPLSS